MRLRFVSLMLVPLLLGCAPEPTRLIAFIASPTPVEGAAPLLPLLPSPTVTVFSPATPTSTPTPTPLPTAVHSRTETSRKETRGAVTLIMTTLSERYEFSGGTVEEIEALMRAFGPTDALGGYRWYALTEPFFDWQYEAQCSDQGCVTGPVTILLTVRYMLPHWIAPDNADGALRGKWAAFEAAVVEHEAGHGALAAECAWRLGETFAGVAAAPSVDELQRAVSAASEPIFADCRAAQRHYEDATNHGATQGVIWLP